MYNRIKLLVCGIFLLAAMVAPAAFGSLTPAAHAAAIPSTGRATGCPTLRYGSQGTWVEVVQVDLNWDGYHGKDGKPLVEDGNYGPNTEYAVRHFQSNHHLTVDGIVGPQTWWELGHPSC
ncbi:hypothetical protein KDH_31890 [Dictyobacter sp. S3.2.2.5]|uniref:Peptidoglycan binding-like domain-containing protein n=1 Tax=Dictyobacter halimunensis TaxID=3026934 RepID=A0ABQ6FRN1_9CHLR|nr:hypothetical protein KDH_31890 [Dictyobacter sp. S3.2.2.5]